MANRFTMPVAVHLFFVRDGRILLLRRCNTGYEDGKYSVPAGHLDGGEQVIAAGIREAREECGVEIDPHDLQVVGVMHRQANDERIDFFVTAAKWTGDIRNTEPEKCDDLSWHPLDRLPDNVIPYVRQALENYRNQAWFASFGWEGA